jgi:lipopolysaccharide/colanic/teichoic acid biosynthesis glycosyltransferase
MRGIPIEKRVFDLIAAGLALLLLSPLMMLVALLILAVDGKPVLFRQPRPGFKGHVFTLYKFRTMRGEVDRRGKPLPDTQRVSSLGRILRVTSLDELPELFNIIRGEMSLVGPRPLLVEYLDRYNAEQMRRHDVLPGLTGWAQVNGRNAISWQEKFRLDVWYVDHWSFWLDLKIVFLTVWKVIRREGISQPGHTTTEYFTGNPPE